MANVLDQSPWIIDTPGAGVLHTGKFRVYSIRWVSPAAAAGHTCTITDEDGKIKWEDVASGANYVTESRVESDWKGVKVTVLSSGKVYIEHA